MVIRQFFHHRVFIVSTIVRFLRLLFIIVFDPHALSDVLIESEDLVVVYFASNLFCFGLFTARETVCMWFVCFVCFC